MRSKPSADTNGWFLYCGDTLSEDPEVFKPLHADHLAAYLPAALQFLGLPPGYRFLLAGDVIDVWRDDALLR